MPPSAKFSRNEIIEAALTLVRSNGLSALTARGLGAQLGASSRPVFTEFRNMEEVRDETILAAKVVYNGYASKALTWPDQFRGMGVQHYLFAKEEPKLYELLFMRSGSTTDVIDLFWSVSDYYETALDTLQKLRGLSREDALTLMQVMVTYVHGVACLLVSGRVQFTDSEVKKQMIAVCVSVRTSLQKGVYGIDDE